jgi:hypothetical protein
LAQPETPKRYLGDSKMATITITITLPEFIEINGASDAPAEYRSVPTEKWGSDFVLAALTHGVSQKLGDTWSVGKKDVEKLKKCHEALAAGDWNTKARTGASEAKVIARIGKLDIKALLAALTPEQHAAILAAGGDISVVTTKPAPKNPAPKEPKPKTV